jgi:hypothetical protein
MRMRRNGSPCFGATRKAQAHLWADEFIVTNTAGEVLSKRQVLDVFEAGIVPYSVFRADDGGRADLRAGRRLDRS